MKKFVSILGLASLLISVPSFAQVEIPTDKDGCYQDGLEYHYCVGQHTISRLQQMIDSAKERGSNDLANSLKTLQDEEKANLKALSGYTSTASASAVKKEEMARKAKGDAVRKNPEAHVCSPEVNESVTCSSGKTYYLKKTSKLGVVDALKRTQRDPATEDFSQGPPLNLTPTGKASNLPCSADGMPTPCN